MNSRRLAFAVLPVVLAAGLGGLGSRRAPSTYARLDKPSWAPPALRRDDRLAAALLTPYLGWCGFATALNAAVSEPADVGP